MFTDFSLDKIARQTALLKKKVRYRDGFTISSLIATEEPEDAAQWSLIKPGKTSTIMEVGDFWKGRDKYLWLHCDVIIPEKFRGKDVVGLFLILDGQEQDLIVVLSLCYILMECHIKGWTRTTRKYFSKTNT